MHKKILAVLGLLAILIASLTPQSNATPLYPHLDKVLHLTVYAIATSYHFWVYSRVKWRKIASALFIYSGIIEILQPIVSNRSGEWLDLLANFLGILTAYGIMKIIYSGNDR